MKLVTADENALASKFMVYLLNLIRFVISHWIFVEIRTFKLLTFQKFKIKLEFIIRRFNSLSEPSMAMSTHEVHSGFH